MNIHQNQRTRLLRKGGETRDELQIRYFPPFGVTRREKVVFKVPIEAKNSDNSDSLLRLSCRLLVVSCEFAGLHSDHAALNRQQAWAINRADKLRIYIFKPNK